MFADRRPRTRHAELATHEVHAAENLRFIRETMEKSATFTAVPGWETVVVGCSALVVSAIAARQADPAIWLTIWLVEACFAVGLGGWATVRKAHAEGIPIFSGPGRKYTLGLLPPMVAAALITIALYRAGACGMLPGVWLLLSGAGIVSGGAASIRAVPVMGLCLMAVGAVGLLAPVGRGDLFMAIGFGGIFILFGIFIARNHGG